MPTLNWIGKDAVVTHHKDVPFRLLEPVPALSCGEPDSGNLIPGKPLRACHQLPGRRDDYGDWKQPLDLVRARLLSADLSSITTQTWH